MLVGFEMMLMLSGSLGQLAWLQLHRVKEDNSKNSIWCSQHLPNWNSEAGCVL